MINIYLFIVTCAATRFCCKNGTNGCEGRCMSLGVVNNGKSDCDDGSDEKVTLAEGMMIKIRRDGSNSLGCMFSDFLLSFLNLKH